MVRVPDPGNGMRSPVYSLGSAVSGSARPGVLGLESPWVPQPRHSLLASESDDVEPGPGSPWGGAGGRWLLWPLRVVLWAVLLIVAYRGVTGIMFNQTASSPGSTVGSAGPAAASGKFPVALAEAYAAEFGRVYLNFSPATQGQREQALAGFVPAGVVSANPDLGWSGTGRMSLQSEQVAGITVQDGQHAVVTLLAMVNGQLMELGVPVVASGNGVVVAGEPAWLPAPPQASAPAPATVRSDPVAQSQLMNELPAFFQAYAGGDSAALSRFVTRGVSLTGLNGAVAFDSIARLVVPRGGAARVITVTVIWQLPGQVQTGAAKLEMTYRMSVVDLQSGKWYVNEISA